MRRKVGCQICGGPDAEYMGGGGVYLCPGCVETLMKGHQAGHQDSSKRVSSGLSRDLRVGGPCSVAALRLSETKRVGFQASVNARKDRKNTEKSKKNGPSTSDFHAERPVPSAFEVQQDEHKSPNDGLLAAVRAYLRRGLFVLPAHPKDKKPLVKYRHRLWRRPTLREWAAWIRKWPRCGIGVVTGTPSGGRIVVDVDDAAVFGACGLPLPETFTVRSANRKAPHYHFKAGGRVKSRHTQWGDVKGEGGFALLPPTPGYDLIANCEVALAPGWVCEARSAQGKKKSRGRVIYNRSLGRARKFGVRKGERVAQGCRLAFEFGRNGRGTWAECERFLVGDWNRKNKPPLSREELDDELLPKAQTSYDDGSAHAGHVDKLRQRKEDRRKFALRNRVVAYLKGVSPRSPTVSEVRTYTHRPAAKVRRVLRALEEEGWVRLERSGTGHRVVWTGSGTVRHSADDKEFGYVRDVKPWKPRRRRHRA